MNTNITLTPVITPMESSLGDKYMIEHKHIPGIILMEQAADEVAVAAASLCLNKSDTILVICGKGNNGGDGLAAARILLTRGYNVKVGVTSEDYSGDAALNFAFFKATGCYTLLKEDNLEEFFTDNASVIIDAIFGTGLSRKPGGIYLALIHLINNHLAKVVSVDIPSGVFGSTGQCSSCINADITVTFQHAKIGHYIYPGAEHVGKLIIKKIGIDDRTSFNTYKLENISFPKRSKNTNKGSYGRLTIIAGSTDYSGAAMLCTHSAMRSGVGLTTCCTDRVTATAIKSALPEAMVKICGENYVCDKSAIKACSNASAIVIGPGLSTNESTAAIVREVVSLPLPKVIDADAINILASYPELLKNSNCVITPHPKEFSILTGLPVSKILSDPVSFTRDYAKKMGITVLLKGAASVVSDGDTTYIITAGAPSMAKGGSGDVLSGVIGSLIAQGYSITKSAYIGAYLCGKAGEAANANLGDYAPLASDTIRNLYF